MMPPWLQWLIGIGAGVGAAAMVWTKVIRPLDKIITYLKEVVPILTDLADHHKKNPVLLDVLAEIAAQFKSDSGSTLRDVVNRLEDAATKNQVAAKELAVKAEVLEVGVAAVKALAVTDRASAVHREGQLDELLDRARKQGVGS